VAGGIIQGMDRIEIVKDCYRAYETEDRSLIEPHLAEDLVFSAPPDVGIDLETYWERCANGAGRMETFEFVRLLEHGDEVITTYEARRKDGSSTRNTEIHTFRGDKVVAVEVYFGWEL
jgi:ketosteroid isomerase-like protein